MKHRWTIGWEHKGFPPRSHGCASDELRDLALTVPGDVSTPLAVLDASALRHNLAAMASWCRHRGVELAPHVKTTMSPELMRMQLEAGAWGTTAATAWQARAQVEMGSSRVLIANESLDVPALTGLVTCMRERRDLEVLVFADSNSAVDVLARTVAAVEGARPIGVVLDVGHSGGRAGVRSHDEALMLAAKIARTDGLLLSGVGGYEGVVGGERSEHFLAAVRKYLRRVRAVAEEVAARGLIQRAEGGIATAGGSMFYDLVADELSGIDGMRTLIRPGCYLTHDHGVYARNGAPAGDTSRPHFLPAMQVFAQVLSTPESGFAIADAGRRDISSDAGMPVVAGLVRDGVQSKVHPEVTVTGFNDQHTFLAFPSPNGDAGLFPQVGDVLALGISHPCTTIDKWRAIAVVGTDGIVTGAVRTVF